MCSSDLIALAFPAALTTEIAMNIETLPIDAVKEYDRNPRTINDAAIDAVAKSIEAFGFKVPILIDADGTIIAWGYDANGEVSSVPAPPAGRRFEKVFGGWGLTLFGLTDDGQLLSWGRNSLGQADVAPLPSGRRYTKAAASYFMGGGLRDDG